MLSEGNEKTKNKGSEGDSVTKSYTYTHTHTHYMHARMDTYILHTYYVFTYNNILSHTRPCHHSIKNRYFYDRSGQAMT
jgi:hypothetical protein